MRNVAAFLIIACLSANAVGVSAQVARNGDINLLPMYGGLEKSRALRKADAQFLAFCDQHFATRKEAAAHHADPIGKQGRGEAVARKAAELLTIEGE